MRIKKLLPRGLMRRLNLRRYPIDRFLEETTKAIPKGAVVIDLGCGECNYRHLFTHCRYYGVDMGIGNVGWDYTKLQAVGDVTHTPFRDGIADVVVSTETLEHLDRPWVFAAEAARLLKPGGTLLLTTPQMARIHQSPHDFFRYTKHGLESLFTRAGFRTERLEAQGGYFIFVADTLKHFDGYLFQPRWIRWPLFPLYWALDIFFGFVVPLGCIALDGLDRKKRFTMGWSAIFRKP